MALTSFRLSKQLLAELDDLVVRGIYISRADAIRNAIHTLLLLESYDSKEPLNYHTSYIQKFSY